MANITLFAQVIGQLPKEIIKSILRKAGTDKHCKGYNTWSQLISMIFCQFSNCDSVRDISNGLRSATGNLNHLGISRAPSKSTVAYQNAHRDSNVFRDIFYALFQYFGQQGGVAAQGLPLQDAYKAARFDAGVPDTVRVRLGTLYRKERGRKDAHAA